MKRFIILIMVMGALLFSGCTLSAKKSTNDAANENIKPSTVDDKSGKGKSESIKSETGKSDTGKLNSDQSKNENVKKKLSVTLYYQDGDGYIIPITRRVEKQEGIARASLNGLVDSAQNREEMEYYGVYPTLPEGTEILGINIKEGTATADFNNKLLSYADKAAERNIISSIVYTLTEFKTISNVKILINGREPKKLQYGTDISGILNRETVMINSKMANLEQGLGKLDIYLFKRISDENVYILPLSIKLSKLKNDDLPGKIIELLGMDYGDRMLYTEMPPETRLLESKIEDNALILNFNDELRNYGGTSREDGLIKQILYSMKQIKGINEVKILIDGKEGNLPEGTDISKEITLPCVINDVIDR